MADASAQRLRARGALRALERPFLYLDRALGPSLPEPLNPFLHTGAVTVTALIVATATGVALLLWYSPSLQHAYASVAAMESAPWTAGLMRSLHRYSSDACVFFAALHALRLFFEGRFAGARWLAWVTGIVSVGVLWAVGWTGYWLVWDERAQHVAVGTAQMLDVLPIIVDPMERSFLFDEAVNSLLFFAVFFVHMLLPLALALGLWLHLARAPRARFLTRAPLTVWVVGSLLLVSVAWPATNAEPARLLALGQRFDMDWWYLAPLALTDRLSGGAVWSALLAVGLVAGTVPWWMTRGRPAVAVVDPVRCNACMQCFQDCPYDAISMVPRTEGPSRWPVQAEVDPARCVGCGICSGACDSAGIELPWLRAPEQRQRIEGWLRDAPDSVDVALVCAESGGGGLEIDADGACAELGGYRVLEVPCAGWINALTLERALRRGAGRVLVVACGEGACHYREGPTWLRMRIDGTRKPAFRSHLVDPERIQVLELDRTRRRSLERAAAAPRARSRLGGVRTGLVSVATAAGVAALIGVGSDLGYAAPAPEGSELVVSFKHPGRVSEECRELSPEEQAERPVHMRRARICERGRAPVRLRVEVDGAIRVDRAYPPGGIWGDLNSIGLERIALAPGPHRVRVALGETPEADEWTYTTERSLRFSNEERRVIAFDRLTGFAFY